VGAPREPVTIFSFRRRPLIPRSFHFFPFWFFAEDADVMRGNYKTPLGGKHNALVLSCFLMLVSKQATPQD